jgi:hypothetical protein
LNLIAVETPDGYDGVCLGARHNVVVSFDRLEAGEGVSAHAQGQGGRSRRIDGSGRCGGGRGRRAGLVRLFVDLVVGIVEERAARFAS